VRLIGDAATNEGVNGATKDKNQDIDEVEAEICFICASPVVHNAVAPCNHRTCHICALRLRALYKTKTCAHCRVSTVNILTEPLA
jgi:DNA mismatch repair ATPase MutL